MPNLFQLPFVAKRPRSDGPIRPERTEELQLLYNRWRDSQDCATSGSTLKQIDEQGRKLQIPPAHGFPSRTPSQRSFNSSSSTHSTNATHEDPHRVKKAQRSGPLSLPEKYRTAFVRKLRACKDCRVRKVRCTHWDFDEFELYYQSSKKSTHYVPYVPRSHHEDQSVTLDRSGDLLGMDQGGALQPYHDFKSAMHLTFTYQNDDPNSLDPTLQPHPFSMDGGEAPILNANNFFPYSLYSGPFMANTQHGAETNLGLEVQAELSDHTPLAGGILAQGIATGSWNPAVATDLFEPNHRELDSMDSITSMMRCQECGRSNDEAWSYCSQCMPRGGSTRDPFIYGNATKGRGTNPY